MDEHRRTGTEVVDGLRGIAILVVVGYHLWLFSWYTPYVKPFGVDIHLDAFARTGYLGVELFFVISGFCLFYPVARARFEQAKAIKPGDYAYRRIIKIVPSYFIALAVTVIIALPRFGHLSDLAFPLFNHVFFFNNWYSDAFGRDNSVLWSLATEMQFYVVFPLLAWAFVRLPAVVMPAMVGAAMLYRWLLFTHGVFDESFTRQVPAYLDTFGFGMLAAYGVVALRTKLPALFRFRPLFTLAAFGLACAAYMLVLSCNNVQYDTNGRDAWDEFNRTWLAGTEGLFIIASTFALKFWRALIANRLLVFLSLISYNLYLWHTLIGIWMWQHKVPYTAAADVHGDDAWKPWYLLICTAVSIGISTAITYFIERPLLGTVKPQPFSFDWKRALPKSFSAPAARSISKAETNT